MTTKNEPNTADSAPAVGGPLERGVGRPEPERGRACEQGCTDYEDDGDSRGCHECAWGKVLGCWRCGGW